MKTWTKFKATRYDSVEHEWYTEINYYAGDFSKVDLSKDWRTKSVEGKRKQLEILEIISAEG